MFFRKICLESFWLVGKILESNSWRNFWRKYFLVAQKILKLICWENLQEKKFSGIIDLKEKQKIVASTGNAAPGNGR